MELIIKIINLERLENKEGRKEKRTKEREWWKTHVSHLSLVTRKDNNNNDNDNENTLFNSDDACVGSLLD